MSHTPEPWWTDDTNIRCSEGGVALAWDPNDTAHQTPIGLANAQRIVAAVNACEGIGTEALENGVVGDLLEALEIVVVGRHWAAHHRAPLTECKDPSCKKTLAAIAKATGR